MNSNNNQNNNNNPIFIDEKNLFQLSEIIVNFTINVLKKMIFF